MKRPRLSLIRLTRGLWRRKWIVLYWLNSALFVIGYSGWYVSPRTFWPAQLSATFLPAFGLIATSSLIFFVRQKRWRYISISITICTLFLIRISLVVDFGAELSAEDHMSLVSLNTRGHGDGGDWSSTFMQEVEKHRPDAIFLQENHFSVGAGGGGGGGASDSIVSGEGARAGSRSIVSQPPVMHLLGSGYNLIQNSVTGNFETDLPIFSRSASNLISFDNTGSLDTLADSVALFVQRQYISLEDRRMALYNVHMASFGSGVPEETAAFWPFSALISTYRQLESDYILRANQVDLLVKILSDEKCTFIVGADLNGTVNNWGYRQLMSMTQSKYSVGNVLGSGTFPTRFPLFRIDFVLGSMDIHFLDFRIGSSTPSDHRPVWATFTFKSY